jgi:cytidine deaminase
MKQREIRIVFNELSGLNELTEEMSELVKEARKISGKAWSPYSGFFVGAAVRLANGMIITGNNQENAAYPSGLCAERTALFYANANYPDVAVEAIAVSARNSRGPVREPVKPCGSCRQVLLETETRFKHPIQIVLDGLNGIYVFEGIDSLLPMSFKPAALKE